MLYSDSNKILCKGTRQKFLAERSEWLNPIFHWRFLYSKFLLCYVAHKCHFNAVVTEAGEEERRNVGGFCALHIELTLKSKLVVTTTGEK